MQAVVILGIFGLFYATVISLTVLLSQSSIQKKLESIQDVRQIFSDFEFAINKGYLEEEPDLETVYADGNMRFVGRYVRWSQDELTTDPWGVDYRVIGLKEDKLLYADAGIDGSVVTTDDNNAVEAPIIAFALVSSGSDRQLQTNLVGITTHTQLLSLEETDDNDDIIHTFTTYAKMADMWDQVRTITDKVVSITREDYKKQYEIFLPRIVQYYTDNGITLIDASGTIVAQSVVDAWKLDVAVLAELKSTNPLCSPCYPEIADDLELLGVDEEIKQMPLIVADSFGVSRVGVYDIVDFSLEESIASTWGISYTIRIEGDDAIK